MKKIGGVIDRRGPGSQERFYINMTKAPFDDIRVRQALLHAVDRKAIKDTLYPGALSDLATSPLPPGYFGHTPVEIPEYNPEKAKQLLAAAGHPNGFPIKDFFIQPRNPKRVQAPFDPEYGEFSLHFNYNYPEMLKMLD